MSESKPVQVAAEKVPHKVKDIGQKAVDTAKEVYDRPLDKGKELAG